METKRSCIVAAKTNEFDVMFTHIRTDAQEIAIILRDNDADEELPPIPFREFRSGLKHAYADKGPVRNPVLRKWLMDHPDADLKQLCQECDDMECAIRTNTVSDISTSTVLNMSTGHLMPQTIEKIKTNLDHFHAAIVPVTIEDEPADSYLVPVPETIGRMPDDLIACLLFADRMDTQFVQFRPDGPMYADIESTRNIGWIPADN